MLKDLTRISIEELNAPAAATSEEAELRSIANGAALGLATLFGPVVMLAIVMAITGNAHVAGAMCFFTYAQLSHQLAGRRALRRKQLILELFRNDRRRRDPAVEAGALNSTLARFSRLHGRISLLEMIGNPVGAIALAAVEVAFFLTPHAKVLQVLVYAAPAVLIGSLAMMLLGLRQLDRLQTQTFATPDARPL